MAIQIHKLKEHYRINNRIPIKPTETIPANSDGGIFLMLSTGSVLTAGLTNNPIVGVSDTKLARTGLPDGTVTCPFRPADKYIFRAPQGALTDEEVATGELLDINGTSDGLASNVNGDLRVTGHHEKHDGTAMVEFEIVNTLAVSTP